MSARSSRPLRVLLLCAALLTGPALSLLAPPATLAATANALEDARRLYDQSRYADAVAALKQALDSGQVLGNDAEQARVLMARSLVKAGKRLEARQEFLQVLRKDADYRIDEAVTPPDEVEVFKLALQSFQAEQQARRDRVPASISGYVGWHKATATSLNSFLERHRFDGGSDLKQLAEYGGSVRFPLRPRWSLELELQSLHATGFAQRFIIAPGDTNTLGYSLDTYASTLSASLYWTWLTRGTKRVYVFGGLGSLNGEGSVIPNNDSGVRLLATENGWYGHLGIEGEYLVTPRLALDLSGLGRYALSKQLNFGGLFAQDFDLEGQRVDFRGFAVKLGLRAYIGY